MSSLCNSSGAGRRLLLESDPSSAPLVERLDEDVSLLDAGVDSAQLVELSLLIEERLGRPLAAEELDRLTTLRSIDDLLRECGGDGHP